jgi:hypothetical protein
MLELMRIESDCTKRMTKTDRRFLALTLEFSSSRCEWEWGIYLGNIPLAPRSETGIADCKGLLRNHNSLCRLPVSPAPREHERPQSRMADSAQPRGVFPAFPICRGGPRAPRRTGTTWGSAISPSSRHPGEASRIRLSGDAHPRTWPGHASHLGECMTSAQSLYLTSELWRREVSAEKPNNPQISSPEPGRHPPATAGGRGEHRIGCQGECAQRQSKPISRCVEAGELPVLARREQLGGNVDYAMIPSPYVGACPPCLDVRGELVASVGALPGSWGNERSGASPVPGHCPSICQQRVAKFFP